MAIDSKLKRASVLSLDSFDDLLPEPDGVIGEADRRMLLGLDARSTAEEAAASGIQIVVPPPPPIIPVSYF